MTLGEAVVKIDALRQVFDTVRLISADYKKLYDIVDGKLCEVPFICEIMHVKRRRCRECVAARALLAKGQCCKLESLGGKTYYIMAQYLEINSDEFILEMVAEVNDDKVFNIPSDDAESELNRRYIDRATGIYNSTYYTEQLEGSDETVGIAIIDIDDLAGINVKYGKQASDRLIKAVSSLLNLRVRLTDTVIRRNESQFMIVFGVIPFDTFNERLEMLLKKIREVRLESCPGLVLSAAIGGAYSSDGGFLEAKAEEQLKLAHTLGNCIKTIEL